LKFYTSVKRYGNSILYRGYDGGHRISKKVKFEPNLFLKDPEGKYTLYESSKTPLKLSSRKFDSISAAKDFTDTHTGVKGFEIYGMTNYVSQYISSEFPTDIKFDINKINITSIDIEVHATDGFPKPDVAAFPINAITLKHSINDTFYTWGLGDFDPSKSEYEVCYFKCANEEQLLKSFLLHWETPINVPDIVTGWNNKLFDMPYIINRINNVLGGNHSARLSPWKKIGTKSVTIMGREEQYYDILGVSIIDYMDVFKKFALQFPKQESYKLDHIADVVLGERKLDISEYGSLVELANTDHQKFIEYNIKDTYLIPRMDDKLGLMSIVLMVAYTAGVNFIDAFGTVGVWDSIIYRRLIGMKMVVPPKKNNQKTSYAGGYVKDPQVGMHSWIASFDVNSLYPNIIVQYNMSHETIRSDISEPSFNVDSLLHKRVSAEYDLPCVANGTYFGVDDVGLIPRIITDIYADRKESKQVMIQGQKDIQGVTDKAEIIRLEKIISINKSKQMAQKILLNALYGAMANIHFRYFDIRIAEGITLMGQLTIKWAERAANEFMNMVMENESPKDYVVAIDTDSVYIAMTDVIDKYKPKNPVDFLDNICGSKFKDKITKAHNEMYDITNGFTHRLEMDREVIADRGIWTAKKRYILNVLDDEGVRLSEPKLKIMGIEAVKSSTPTRVRSALKDAFKIIMKSTEADMQKFIREFKDEFNKLPAEDVSFPRGCNNINDYIDPITTYRKGTPIHVRGALVFNKILKEKKLNRQYEEIKSGDRIKFAYLKMPNSVKENVVSFPNFLPKELDLSQYIDYNIQFDKTFIKPISSILDVIGWEAAPTASLEAFFE
tara:strand:- start:1456 stop:3966 length:2511 start_codon:yes stop_codon:yes gene_type:complete